MRVGGWRGESLAALRSLARDLPSPVGCWQMPELSSAGAQLAVGFDTLCRKSLQRADSTSLALGDVTVPGILEKVAGEEMCVRYDARVALTLSPTSMPPQSQLKPNSNPTQSHLKPNSNPTQAQLKPNALKPVTAAPRLTPMP